MSKYPQPKLSIRQLNSFNVRASEREDLYGQIALYFDELNSSWSTAVAHSGEGLGGLNLLLSSHKMISVCVHKIKNKKCDVKVKAKCVEGTIALPIDDREMR